MTVQWTIGVEAWWKDPLNPTLGGVFRTRTKPRPERPIRQGVHRPLGARFPVVVSDRRQATVGEFVVQTNSADEWDLFAELLDSNVLLVQTPPGSPWYLGDGGNLYIVAGSIREDDIDQRTLHPHRRWVVPYNEVARPSAEA
jgi:hypothetical protein